MISPKITNLGYSNLWTSMSTILGYASNFDQQIQKLFANGEQGFFYDPNDLSTMFQDAVGTVPVTAAGQPVGLLLDKSKGMVLGDNYLTTDTLDFTIGWADTASVTAKSKNSFTVNGTGGCFAVFDGLIGKAVSVRLKGRCGVSWVFRNGTDLNGAVNVPAGEFDVTSTNPAIFKNYASIYFTINGASTLTLDSISVDEIKGNHAYQAASAARPILRKNAVTGANYLEFDGSDDFLQTSNIDFTSTGKVTSITAINASTSIGCVFETGSSLPTTDGTFGLFRGDKLQFGARGTMYRLINMDAVVIPEVLVVKADIENGNISVNQNGQPFSTLNQSLGIGKFGNHPLYIGRRAGTTLPFVGRVYGLIGISKLTTDNETAAIEKELAKRVGVTLNV